MGALLSPASAPVALSSFALDKGVESTRKVQTRDELQETVKRLSVQTKTRLTIVDANGDAVPADIEFGFLNGQLQLFQIRPFLESQHARSNAYLNQLDAQMNDLAQITVNLDEVAQ